MKPLPATQALVPEFTNMDVGFAQLLISNLIDAKKNHEILFFKVSDSFVEKLYYHTDIKLNCRTLKNHINELISNGYLEVHKAQKWMYNPKSKNIFFYMVDGIVASDKFKEAIDVTNHPLNLKKCKGCGNVKLLEAFDKEKNGRDGHKNYCKECRKKCRK